MNRDTTPEDTTPDVDLCDQLPVYNGWRASYEYPGYIWYFHPGTRWTVCVCSDFNDEQTLDIQIQDTTTGDQHPTLEGDVVATWPYAGRTAEKMFEHIKPWLDKLQPEELKTEDGR